MTYTFQRECGAVVSAYNQLVSLVTNNSMGSVDFPIEQILEIHKRTPGYITRLVHTHPPLATELSQRDIKTLKILAFTLSPYPIAMSVIVPSPDYDSFVERIWVAVLEPKEMWEARGKGERQFSVEFMTEVATDEIGDLLITKSYENTGVN